MNTNELTHATGRCKFDFRISMGAVTRYFISSSIPWGSRGCQGKETTALDDLGAEAEGLP